MNEMIPMENRGMTAADVKAGVQLIQQVMESVMIRDVHYGTIPGTPKPTLYKAGSEKILTTFRIAAYPKEVDDLSTRDEARFRVKVHGIHQPTNMLIGVGIGECSSDEEKYKWRKPVCDQEFDATPEDRKRVKWNKGNPPYQVKQIRTNPADVANTILKMAKKRAQIDMTLTATAASDVFDQDLEDLPEGMAGQAAEQKAPIKEPQKKSSPATAVSTNAEKPRVSEIAPLTATVKVQEVASKNGEKNGKPYTIYTIIDENNEKYGTFSDTFADLARSSTPDGIPVTITYTEGQYGKKVVSVDLADVREPGAEG